MPAINPRMGRNVKETPAPWRPALNCWRDHLFAQGSPESTWKVRLWQLRRFAASHPHGPLSVSPQDCAQWLATPRHRHWSAATRYAEVAALRSFFGWYQSTGERPDNPAAKLRPPKVIPTPKPPTPEVLPPIERKDVALAIDLAMRLGLRRAEIVQVHRRDLKRGADGWSLVVHGKGAKDRLVPLPEDVAGVLLGFRGFVFPSKRSASGHMSASRMGTLISEALPPGFTAHSCRRRFGRAAFQAGDLRAVQMLLGHHSPAVTQVYLFVDQPALRKAVELAARPVA